MASYMYKNVKITIEVGIMNTTVSYGSTLIGWDHSVGFVANPEPSWHADVVRMLKDAENEIDVIFERADLQAQRTAEAEKIVEARS